jgi:outer membrane protein OmpA-like peptidoglycan-associated protein
MPQLRNNEGRKCGTRPPLAAALALLVALGGCNAAIATYRNMRGLSKNDPNPATTPNTKNLARAEAEPYPNLASVPPPPTGVSTAAERAQQIKSLTTSRVDLDAIAQKLRAGAVLAFAPPPPPPPLPSGAAIGNPPVPPGTKLTLGPGPRQSHQPPVPGPLEWRLVSPRIASTPQPEASRPAPPPPHLAALPVPPPAALPAPPGSPGGPTRRSEASQKAAPRAAALAAVGFQPPPPPPPLALAPSALPATPKPPVPTAAIELAEIRFPAAATRLAAGDRSIVARVAALYHRRPGMLRIIGYAERGGDARRQLASFRAALDRAQAVAAALERAGIPAAKIKIEAAPIGADRGSMNGVGADSGGARAEIMLQP